jgi:hypothetical protein
LVNEAQTDRSDLKQSGHNSSLNGINVSLGATSTIRGKAKVGGIIKKPDVTTESGFLPQI